MRRKWTLWKNIVLYIPRTNISPYFLRNSLFSLSGQVTLEGWRVRKAKTTLEGHGGGDLHVLAYFFSSDESD